MNRTEYEAAKATLREASVAYYTDGSSPLDDATYDALLREASEFERSNHVSGDVVGDVIAAGAAVSGTVRHEVPMLSLDNIYTPAEMFQWAAGLPAGSSLVVEPKLDGMAMSIHYARGVPVRMLTRGDGRMGEDVTRALGLLSNIPRDAHEMFRGHLRNDFFGEVRGEVVFSHEQFEQANAVRVANGLPAYANARNAVAGAVNKASRSGEVPEGVRASFIVYALVDEDDTSTTHSGAMERLAEMGFTTAMSLLVDQPLEPRRADIDFDCDGLVYKVDDVRTQRSLGASSRAPRWARAYKFEPQEAITTLRDVVWRTGRTGSVTPRAVLDPVKVGGATVGSATLNNPDDIARKALFVGAHVVVRRAAEVIPEVTGLAPDSVEVGQRLMDAGHVPGSGVRSIVAPTTCPNCGEVLDTSQARLRCPSGGECAPEAKLTYAVSRDALDIEGLSERSVAKLVDNGALRDVSDIFELSSRRDLLVEALNSEVVADKVLAEVERARTEATFERVVIALGMRLTGRSLSKRIATHFGSMDALLDAGADELAEVDKLGPVKAASLHRQLHTPEMADCIDRLAVAGLAMEVEQATGPQPLAGHLIVVTGSMKRLGSRSEVTGNLEALGAQVGSSVGSKTTLVVADDPEGSSSKLVKARKLGVRILDEDAFISEFGLDA